MSSSTRITLAILALLGIGVVAYYAMNTGEVEPPSADPTPALVSPPVRTDRTLPRSADSNKTHGRAVDLAQRPIGTTPIGGLRPAETGGTSTPTGPAAIEHLAVGEKGGPVEPSQPLVDAAPLRPMGGTGIESAGVSETGSSPGIVAPPTGSSGPTTNPSAPPVHPMTAPPTLPAAPPATVPPPAPRFETYTVVEGDNMWTIAQQWFGDGSKWDLIAKLNLVDPQHLKVGQILRMPPKTATRPEPAPEPASSPAGARAYVVASGDTLRRIAYRHYGDANNWQPIYDANRVVIGPNPHELQVGMKLTIPPASKSSGASR